MLLDKSSILHESPVCLPLIYGIHSCVTDERDKVRESGVFQLGTGLWFPFELSLFNMWLRNFHSTNLEARSLLFINQVRVISLCKVPESRLQFTLCYTTQSGKLCPVHRKCKQIQPCCSYNPVVLNMLIGLYDFMKMFNTPKIAADGPTWIP